MATLVWLLAWAGAEAVHFPAPHLGALWPTCRARALRKTRNNAAAESHDIDGSPRMALGSPGA